MTRFEKRFDLLPFYLFEPSYLGHLTTEMERMLEEFAVDRTALRPVWQKPETEVAWTPRIEIVLEHNELMVRAELPGIEPKDVTVEVNDGRLVLKGTRHKTFKPKEEYIKTERLYGEFYRAIPLPEGAIAEAATAAFVNGVLEIRLPVPPRPEPKTRKVNVEVKPVLEAPKTPLIKQTAAV